MLRRKTQKNMNKARVAEAARGSITLSRCNLWPTTDDQRPTIRFSDFQRSL